jgi:putative hydrolase of HD superfamily
MTTERLGKQLRFITEIDKLKTQLRQTVLTDASRRENSAEHSWHVTVMAVLLHEHADCGDIDVFRVARMLLVHDIVEIDAGDTFCYDEEGAKDKRARETQAADRIFALLPADQAEEIRGLWDEFEERRTPEARFAAALDRLQPLLHNACTDGEAWRKHGVRADRVLSHNEHIREGSRSLWAYAEQLIHDAVARGILAE